MRSANFTQRETAAFLVGLAVGAFIEAGIWLAWMALR